MNSKMRGRFGKIFSDGQLPASPGLPDELAAIIEPGLEREGDAVLLSSQRSMTATVQPSFFPDLTGYECFVNHIHIEDYVSTTLEHDALLEQGVMFAVSLKDMLSSLWNGERFRIILSSFADGCNVRFHKVRDDETWLSSDLESYEELILELETDGC